MSRSNSSRRTHGGYLAATTASGATEGNGLEYPDGALGIEFLELGEDWLKARMPVDRRTHQPYGILHGGASVALAETLGSVAANLCVDSGRKRCVGLEINANHLRAVRSGYVVGIARPLHLGATTQVWDIRIATEAGKAVCISRLTLAVLDAVR